MGKAEPAIVLVCGGRDYADKRRVYEVLDGWDVELLIHGGASGADSIAAAWAMEREVNCLRVPAKWKKHGRRAGPLRNREMAKMKPDVVLAFPGGRGTSDMITTAHELGLNVVQIGEPSPG